MKRIWASLILLALVIVVGLVWWTNGVSAKNPADKAYSSFIIPQGEGVREIANDLKEQGFIKDQVVFFLLTKRLGLDKQIQAGHYRISPSMNAESIAKALTHGTLDIWVTIPEGYRAAQIAEALQEIPTYEDSWASELEEHEGYLFPETYLIPKEATIEQVIEILTSEFEKRYSTLPKSQKFSKEDIVTLASLVEREARHAEDRPIVASVIINRLDIGMRLDIDATVQYAKGEVNGKWWTPITQADYSLRSDYNTYLINGLPPTPISNPGLPSMQAVLSPTDTPYLYYITDKNGVNRYAKTFEEHQANIKKYGL